MGGTASAGGLYGAIIAVLVESSALYLIALLLYMGPWAAKSPIQYIFVQILVQIQVRAASLLAKRNINTCMLCRTGHRAISHHFTSRRSEGVDGRYSHCQEY